MLTEVTDEVGIDRRTIAEIAAVLQEYNDTDRQSDDIYGALVEIEQIVQTAGFDTGTSAIW